MIEMLRERGGAACCAGHTGCWTGECDTLISAIAEACLRDTELSMTERLIVGQRTLQLPHRGYMSQMLKRSIAGSTRNSVQCAHACQGRSAAACYLWLEPGHQSSAPWAIMMDVESTQDGPTPYHCGLLH